MGTWIATVVLLLFFLIAVGNSGSNTLCIEKERSALLSFRKGLTDPSNRLSSWSVQNREDCCRWTGVRCNNVRGQVVGLHLRNPYNFIDDKWVSYNMSKLGGEINPSLLELEFLSYLDLSWNDFRDTPIPSYFGSMTSLTYLNLSSALFIGLVPHQLGNLSGLRYLNLGDHYYYNGLFVENLSWISGLHSLEYLDMSGIDLHKEVDWIQEVSTLLPSLSELYLPNCRLESMYPFVNYYLNFTSLAVLDLSHNNFHHELPNWLSNLSTTLQHLDLLGNSLQGQIPNTMSDIRTLNYLDLGFNNLTGKIPEWLGQLIHLKRHFLDSNSFYGPIPGTLGNLSSLMTLYLSNNHLNGNFPKNLWLLSHLEELSIGDNPLLGTVSEENFAKLSKLKLLDMSSTSLFFNVSSNWVPPFQLEYMRMRSCQMGPRFPLWLQTQTSLSYLDISQSGIFDTAPDWFWNLNCSFVDISSNRFKGQLPHISTNVRRLIIGNNSFSGPISSFLCQKFNGKNNLRLLDVSHNHLSGELSHCWMHWQSLVYINLETNNLSGKIPKSMGSLSNLVSLYLHGNRFSGRIPPSLQNCTSLALIDLGSNEFTGAIPSWMGERTSQLKVLRLRSNKFIGNIPKQICQLAYICVLDLANNNLSGTIPKCLNNISSMVMTDFLDNLTVGYYGNDNVLINVKGLEREYINSQIRDMRSIDLSSNDLSGLIPVEITSLLALRLLNLSYNRLTGMIPDNIGNMYLLDSLDLSRNHLMGHIPLSLSNLTFLGYLNLSYNNFSGRIPSGTQLQSFDATSYVGNAELCGAPLNYKCTRGEEFPGPTPVGEGGNEFEVVWFYTGLGPGFAAGFWGVCGVLFFKRNWRHAFFHLLDDMKDWIYVATMLKVKWFCQKFNSFTNV